MLASHGSQEVPRLTFEDIEDKNPWEEAARLAYEQWLGHVKKLGRENQGLLLFESLEIGVFRGPALVAFGPGGTFTEVPPFHTQIGDVPSQFRYLTGYILAEDIPI